MNQVKITMTKLQERVDAATTAYWNVLNKKYRTNYPRPAITWDSSQFKKSLQRAAGLCIHERLIAFHPIISMEHPYETINDTVPHEIAHAFVRAKFGYDCQSHGREWLNVMREIGKADAAATYAKLDGVMMDPRHQRMILRHRVKNGIIKVRKP